jgi:CheY-like chemotaxis protein
MRRLREAELHERVLVVDDEPLVRQYAAMQLRSLGYDVDAASSGSEALEVLTDDNGFKVLLTDVVMPPGMSGIELLKCVRAKGLDVKVLLTSGFSEEVFGKEGRPDAGTPLLKKPYRRAQLAEMMERVLTA